MTESNLLAELISHAAARHRDALDYGQQSMSYGALQQAITGFTGGVVSLGLQRGERIAIDLEKRLETVVASFAVILAGRVLVPLKPPPKIAGPLAWRRWDELLRPVGRRNGHWVIDTNVVAGAKNVASCLAIIADETRLVALPLSFDGGFSQLSTAFQADARVVLFNDVVPRETLASLRTRLPKSKPFVMYGLTEAFHSTYLPPEEVDQPPDSIGKTISNAEIPDLRRDGSAYAAHEPGELVGMGSSGTIARRQRHASKPCRPRRSGAAASWCSPKSPFSPGTPCSSTRRCSLTSSVVATK